MTCTLYYFPIRGKAEVIKLLLAWAKAPYKLKAVDYAEQKANLDLYPFGQCPRMVDDGVNLVQSNAIIRHVARKHGLYGKTEAEMCTVDMVLDGVEDLRMKYVALIYTALLAADAKAAYWETHGAKASATGQRNGGAHFEYLARLLRSAGGPFYAGAAPTAADVAVFDIVDLHLRPSLFPEEVKAAYPELVEHHARVGALPGVKEYLASDLRLPDPNNNKLG